MASDSPRTVQPAAEPARGQPPSTTRATLRIDFPSGRSFGPGKARLLELIAEHGSISAAGRAMGMSYRRAWLLVDDVNATFSSRLVTAQAGGASGGRAVLTDLGRDVLATYRQAESAAGALPGVAALTAFLPG